ncbi:a1-alpha2 repression [Gonapodya sp. JEL0774]|nr:a1-alpha2 repression [Gonapodya sp. JEL0774]
MRWFTLQKRCDLFLAGRKPHASHSEGLSPERPEAISLQPQRGQRVKFDSNDLGVFMRSTCDNRENVKEAWAGVWILVTKWHAQSEDLLREHDLDPEVVDRVKQSEYVWRRWKGVEGANDPSLAPMWRHLTRHVDQDTVRRVVPAQGKVSGMVTSSYYSDVDMGAGKGGTVVGGAGPGAHEGTGTATVAGRGRTVWGKPRDTAPEGETPPSGGPSSSLSRGAPALDSDLPLHFLPFDLRKSFPPTATGRDRTVYSLDKSWLLRHVVATHLRGEYEGLLAEMELTFLLFYPAGIFDGFEHYGNLVEMVARAEEAVRDAVGAAMGGQGEVGGTAPSVPVPVPDVAFFTSFAEILTAQTSCMPEEFSEEFGGTVSMAGPLGGGAGSAYTEGGAGGASKHGATATASSRRRRKGMGNRLKEAIKVGPTSEAIFSYGVSKLTNRVSLGIKLLFSSFFFSHQEFYITVLECTASTSTPSSPPPSHPATPVSPLLTSVTTLLNALRDRFGWDIEADVARGRQREDRRVRALIAGGSGGGGGRVNKTGRGRWGGGGMIDPDRAHDDEDEDEDDGVVGYVVGGERDRGSSEDEEEDDEDAPVVVEL